VLSIINHNIANANTPGYSRQRVNMAARGSMLGLFSSGGSGVDVTGIQRLTDGFMLGQLGRARADQGEQQAMARSYGTLEILFGEPVDDVMGESGLGDAISGFLSGWQPVINPELETNEADMRGLIIESAGVLTHRFHTLTEGIGEEASSLQTDLNHKVEELNSIIATVAQFNAQLGSGSLSESVRNDILDSRQIHLERLAALAGATWESDEQGHLRVYLGGRVLVDNTSHHGLETRLEGTPSDGLRHMSILSEAGDVAINLPGGEMKGLLHMLNEEIPSMQDQLDRLAANLIAEVNSIHQAAGGDGGGGVDFFVGQDAASIAINPVILSHPDMVSLTGTLADGRDIASAMFDLQTQALDSESGMTIEGLYATMVGNLGARSASAAQLSSVAQRLTEGMEEKLASTAGVSLDEELANMMVAQTNYQAASKVITMVDELLATVLSML